MIGFPSQSDHPCARSANKSLTLPLLALKIVDHVLQARAEMTRGVAAIHQVQGFDQKLARLLQELVRRRAGGFVRAVHLKSPFPKI